MRAKQHIEKPGQTNNGIVTIRAQTEFRPAALRNSLRLRDGLRVKTYPVSSGQQPVSRMELRKNVWKNDELYSQTGQYGIQEYATPDLKPHV